MNLFLPIKQDEHMKYFFNFLLIVCICSNSSYVSAQSFEIPVNPTLETQEDYKKYEPVVLQSIDWYHNTPTDEMEDERTLVSRFIIQWITGSPSVTIEINTDFVVADSPEYLMAYMNGWIKYSLENNYSSNQTEATLAGLEMSIEFYLRNKKILGKNKAMEKFVKKQKKGKLKKFVTSKFE